MGDAMKDSTTIDIIVQLNNRFDAEWLPEMIELQREFKVFSPKHSLRQSLALLGIVPTDATERQGWYRFLDSLMKYDSDLPNVTGHDRAIKVIQKNLEAETPLPIAIVCHAALLQGTILAAAGTDDTEARRLLDRADQLLRISGAGFFEPQLARLRLHLERHE